MKKKPEDSPYLNARYNHNSRESAMFFSRLMWQIVGIVSMLTVLGCVAGIIYVAIQAKYIPFVIKVDKLGQPLAVSVADKAPPSIPASSKLRSLPSSTMPAWLRRTSQSSAMPFSESTPI